MTTCQKIKIVWSWACCQAGQDFTGEDPPTVQLELWQRNPSTGANTRQSDVVKVADVGEWQHLVQDFGEVVAKGDTGEGPCYWEWDETTGEICSPDLPANIGTDDGLRLHPDNTFYVATVEFKGETLVRRFQIDADHKPFYDLNADGDGCVNVGFVAVDDITDGAHVPNASHVGFNYTIFGNGTLTYPVFGTQPDGTKTQLDDLAALQAWVDAHIATGLMIDETTRTVIGVVPAGIDYGFGISEDENVSGGSSIQTASEVPFAPTTPGGNITATYTQQAVEQIEQMIVDNADDIADKMADVAANAAAIAANETAVASNSAGIAANASTIATVSGTVTANTDTLNAAITALTANSGDIADNAAALADIPNVLDEDNFASNSETAVPTQQSVKAYLDEFRISSIDPREHGIVFDAVYSDATQTWSGTDNTAAWEALITALGTINNVTNGGGWRIVCPPGASLSNGAHDLPHRVIVEGVGHGTQLVCQGDNVGFFTITGRYQHFRDLHFIAGGKGDTVRPYCLVIERMARGSIKDCTFTQPHHDQSANWWDEAGIGNGIFSCDFAGLRFHHDDPDAHPADGDAEGITAPTWHHFGSGANFNANSMRDFDMFTGGGPDQHPTILIGSSTTRVHNNVFDRIIGEICTGGVIHVTAAGSCEFRNVSLHDTASLTLLAPTLKLGDAGTFGSFNNLITSYDRRDGTLAPGVSDIEITSQGRENTLIGVGERTNQRIEVALNGSTAVVANRIVEGTTPGNGVFVSGSENALFLESGSVFRGPDSDNLVDALGAPLRTILAADSAPKQNDTDNSTAATVDPIELALGPGTYKINAELFYNSNTTADFAARMFAVGGATSMTNVVGEGIVNNDAEGITGQITRILGLATLVAVSGTSGGQDAHMSFSGTVTVDTATTLTVRWSQRVADPSDTILRAGSYLEAMQI